MRILGCDIFVKGGLKTTYTETSKFCLCFVLRSFRDGGYYFQNQFAFFPNNLVALHHLGSWYACSLNSESHDDIASCPKCARAPKQAPDVLILDRSSSFTAHDVLRAIHTVNVSLAENIRFVCWLIPCRTRGSGSALRTMVLSILPIRLWRWALIWSHIRRSRPLVWVLIKVLDHRCLARTAAS